MSKKIILMMATCFLMTLARKNRSESTYVQEFPVLFRDHTYYELSKKGKEQFFAVNIHPLCKEKNGECISRQKCYGREKLFISRICYKHDLVCCYDNSIKFPEVADPSYKGVPPSNTTTTPQPTDPTVLP